MTPSEPCQTDRPDTDSADDRRVLDVLDAAVRSMGGSPRQGQTTMAREVAQTLADDLGITTAVLDPIESQTDASKDYAATMNSNIDALTKALDCQ